MGNELWVITVGPPLAFVASTVMRYRERAHRSSIHDILLIYFILSYPHGSCMIKTISYIFICLYMYFLP